MNIYLQQIVNQSLPNKYTNWYISIISNALTRTTTEYTEKHHILPKSFGLGGSKDKENLVILTGREHFVCHQLLTKMVVGDFKKKMWYALWRIVNIRKQFARVNSRQYAIWREEISIIHRKRIVSESTRKKQSEAIKGTHIGWHHTPAAKKKISDAHIGKAKAPFTKEHIKNLSLSHSGEKHKNFGKHHSTATRQKISSTMTSPKSKYHVILVSCLRCKTVTNIGNYTKHHGANCKH